MKRNPSIKIISGFNKGLKINFKPSIDLRPTSNRLKKVLFDWIQFELKDSVCLDLFAGTGNLGLECISRGAKKVIFVENYKNVLKILKKNIHNLKSINNYEIFEKNIYETDLDFYKKDTFNIIYLDPPFKDKNLDKLLSKIQNYTLLKKNGIIIGKALALFLQFQIVQKTLIL